MIKGFHHAQITIPPGTEEGIDHLRTKAHLAYEVDDLVQIEEKLKNNGIEIISAIPISGFERFEFRDPFGN
ncbi:VOC family protein [Paenibacillus glacialis]|uniref:VOC domain-containing protein n=1 Tax=Paenibacillus glacialis TaxID=494026 RepID=A0A168K9L1_9BACL|nr:VOC family protein [Paenibacillus glacialis]OAB41739.1 hypothetical protein PGLA_15840 [Paenibacillus glacialis]